MKSVQLAAGRLALPHIGKFDCYETNNKYSNIHQNVKLCFTHLRFDKMFNLLNCPHINKTWSSNKYLIIKKRKAHQHQHRTGLNHILYFIICKNIRL